MSNLYIPGEWSHRYKRLPLPEQARIAAEADRIFIATTGVTRNLDPNSDRDLMRKWLRIRDEVMSRPADGGRTTSKVPGPYRSTGSLITGSVGEGGHNYERDVIFVKWLLNNIPDDLLYDWDEQWKKQEDGNFALEVGTLAPNGTVTQGMIDRIILVQRRWAGMARPDGRIDPGKRTIRDLLQLFLNTGWVLRLNSVEGRIHPASTITLSGDVPIMFAGLQFKCGTVVDGLDGKRLILSITISETIFVLLDRSGPGSGLQDLNPMRGKVGGIYAQMTDAFINEFISCFYKDMYDVLAPLVTIIEAEVNLLLAIGTTLTGTGLLYGGVALSAFIVQNKNKFKDWIAIIEAIIEARNELKLIAPTVYSNIFDAVFKFYGRSLTPANAASYVGKIIGEGGKALWTNKINIFASVGSLILSAASVLAKNLPDSIARAEQLWKDGARTLMVELRSQGVEVTPQEQIAIFQEIRAHPKEIAQIFQRLITKINEHI